MISLFEEAAILSLFLFDFFKNLLAVPIALIYSILSLSVEPEEL